MPKVHPSVGWSCMALNISDLSENLLNLQAHLKPFSPRKVLPSALPSVASMPATFASPLEIIVERKEGRTMCKDVLDL